MIDPELIEQLSPYIKSDPSKTSWVEMGLVDDAPASVVIAFEHFLEIQKDAEKRGIEI